MHPSSATRSHSFAASLPSPNPSEPLLIGVEEVARLLNVSPRTVWTLTATGELPHLRIGRRVLYSSEGVRSWTQSRLQAVVPTAATPPPSPAPSSPAATVSRRPATDRAPSLFQGGD